MPNPVNMQDVADRAGVHRSTVSLALRHNPKISSEIRQRVMQAARDLGYRANPLVAALMRSRRGRHPSKHVVIAYVTCYSTRYGWRPPHHDRPDYFPAAAARASELGYKLEHFWLAEPGMTPARFAQILISRGISGMLIGRLPPGLSEIHLPWEHFSAVAVGLTLLRPELHRVAEDAFASGSEAINQCLARGWRRIGFVVTEPNDSPNMAKRWQGAYLQEQLHMAESNRLPILEYAPQADFRTQFFAWYDRYRPDAILTTFATPILDAFASRGQTGGSTATIVLLVNDKPEQGYAGIYLNPGIVGALAVDMVVGMMHRGETGLPAEPHHVLVPGKWVQGERAAPKLDIWPAQIPAVV